MLVYVKMLIRTLYAKHLFVCKEQCHPKQRSWSCQLQLTPNCQVKILAPPRYGNFDTFPTGVWIYLHFQSHANSCLPECKLLLS